MSVNYCTHVVVQLINSNCQPLKAVKDEPKRIRYLEKVLAEVLYYCNFVNLVVESLNSKYYNLSYNLCEIK